MDKPGTAHAGWMSGARAIYAHHPHVWACIALAVLVLTAYGRSIRHGFVWDDHGLIVNNPALRETSATSKAFSKGFWAIGVNYEDPGRSFYRPLISLSYAVEYRLWGLSPAGFHVTNVVVHFLCAMLVYAFGCRLLDNGLRRGQPAELPAEKQAHQEQGGLSPVRPGDMGIVQSCEQEVLFRRFLSLLAAGIFAAHPVHVENVCWISGRTDVFCAFFFLTAILIFLRWLKRPSVLSAVACAVVFLAALLSKEAAIPLPALMIAAFVFTPRSQRPPLSRSALILGAVALVTFAYMLARLVLLGSAFGTPSDGTAVQRLATIPVVFVKYLGLLANLVPVDPHHSEALVRHISDPRLLPAIPGTALFFAALAIAVRKGAHSLAFLLVWIVITLLPVFNLGTFGDVILADRFLYLPSIGFALAVVELARHAFVRRPVLVRAGGIIYAVFMACLVFLSCRNAAYWSDNVSLFSRAALTSPHSSYIFFNLGNSLAERGDNALAVKAYRKATTIQPDYGQAYANMGITLTKLGKYAEAVAAFRQAIHLKDRSTVAYTGLGDSYRRLGQTADAMSAYEESLRIGETATAHNNLGECLMAEGEFVPALAHFNSALRIEVHPGTLNNIGLLYIKQGNFISAVEILGRALSLPPEKIPPDHAVAIHCNMARALSKLNRKEASDHARQALKLIHEGHGPAKPLSLIEEMESYMRGAATSPP